MTAFEEMVALAESGEEYDSNGGGTRGYNVSVWYAVGTRSFVVDYDTSGGAVRVQEVGTKVVRYNKGWGGCDDGD